jgi:hypothetical protein
MEEGLSRQRERRSEKMIPVIRNFQQVIENKDIGVMNKELYEFLNLYCGFIAHYNINGFKATYKNPEDFAEVFIRHFDPHHQYYSGVYACHKSPYKETGMTEAQIKREFEKIVQNHKDKIIRWAKEKQRNERYALYLKLKKEFEGGEKDEHRL